MQSGCFESTYHLPRILSLLSLLFFNPLRCLSLVCTHARTHACFDILVILPPTMRIEACRSLFPKGETQHGTHHDEKTKLDTKTEIDENEERTYILKNQ